MENNSHKFFESVGPEIVYARERAKRNNEWAKSHIMVNPETGEVVTNKEGEVLTLAEMSKSWYSEQGGRNNAYSIVKRLKRVNGFKCDLRKHRPKFITLTFAGVEQSWQADRAIQKFLNAARTWGKRKSVKLIAYFWTSEVQERGALHYHILILGLPFVTKEQLRSWWSYGFVDIRAVDDIGRAFKYLAKYLWKWGHLAGEPDNLPDWWFLFSVYSKRRYGFSKWFTLPPVERIPRWLKEILEECGGLKLLEKAGRAEGGGWLISVRREDTLETLSFASPFKVQACKTPREAG